MNADYGRRSVMNFPREDEAFIKTLATHRGALA
jgi:hypothetical protein